MNKFIPFEDKIEVEPFKKEGILVSDERVKVGKVVAVGSAVKFVKVGDTLYFEAWACVETDGDEKRFIVPECSEAILGKNDA